MKWKTMRIQKLKNGNIKIKKSDISATYNAKTQQLVYDDGYYIFGVYLGKWRRMQEVEKLKFIRWMLIYLHRDEPYTDYGALFRIGDLVRRMFNLIVQELENAKS